jgi:hypothetical protein
MATIRTTPGGPVTRRFRIALLVASLAVLAASCANSSVAAEVNGTPITDADVLGVRSGDVGAVIAGDRFRSDLTTLIIAQATLDAAEEDFGISGFDTPEARDTWLATGATEQDIALVDSISANADLTDSAVDLVTTQLMVRSAILDALAQDPDILMSIWDDAQGSLVDVCARHILVGTEEEADAARERVLAGEDFGVVADEVSLDSAPEGVLPCPTNPASFVEPFATVVSTQEIGEIGEPFQTQFGWHVAVVDSREGPTSYEEFAADPRRWAPDTAFTNAFGMWSDAALARTEVTVRSQIGEWFPQGDGVLPPPASP